MSCEFEKEIHESRAEFMNQCSMLLWVGKIDRKKGRESDLISITTSFVKNLTSENHTKKSWKYQFLVSEKA